LYLAQKAGFTRIVEFDPTLSRFFHTSEFDEALQPFIEEYDDIAFWDGLVDRMADRDFEETYGDAAARMPPDDRFNKYGVCVDKYESEIETHGIDRLRIAEA